ncbi:MAG: response regulator [Thermostichales cyanobacterium HHBFW_bins_127]
MVRLLLVEDNEMNRDMLVRRLQKKGFEIICATDGAEGVEKAYQTEPDLILMDLSLPVMDGWEATRRLKASEHTKGIPVIALTAHAMSGDREKALEAGCDDYDTKPIDLPRLLGKIDTLLSRSQPHLAPPPPTLALSPAPMPTPDSGIPNLPRLLVVDDNEMNRDMLSRRLQRQGYSVVVAEGGQQACRLLSEGQFDLVLLDVMMPDMSGIEVLQWIRQQHSSADLPVIMVTAKDSSEDVAGALELGANDYITKPIDFTVAQARIKAQLSRLESSRRQQAMLEAQIKTAQEQATQALGGRYHVVRVLGSGGFSQTFLAEDQQRPGRPLVVVKQLRPPQTDPRAMEISRRLFNTEAETLEKLGRHDQIPQLLAYFEQNNEFYLVQEYIEGTMLSDELNQRRFSELQVLVMLLDILGILDFIHSHHVIHRDIKPQNIIRRKADHKLVLIDFGAVKEFQGEAGNKTIAIGTRGYAPMEQYAGRPRPNSDIFAIGMVAIQALSGRYPHQLLEDPMTGAVRWQEEIRVSPRLAKVLDKMIDPNSNTRYQTATAVMQDLSKIPPTALRR